MTGKLVILSGPSGVGKDTVIDAWKESEPRVERVVAYTTRPPREGEVDGIDYHFVSLGDFEKMAAAGDFLEYKKVYENYYATPLKDMETLLAAGKIAVLKIDVQGALAAMAKRPDAVTIFLLPPSIEELRRRIKGRASDSPETIEKRLAFAEHEMSHSEEYQHRIINDEIGSVVEQLRAVTT